MERRGTHIQGGGGERESKGGGAHLQGEGRKEEVKSERDTGTHGKRGGEVKRRRGTYTRGRGVLKNMEGHLYKERGEREEVKRRRGTCTRKEEKGGERGSKQRVWEGKSNSERGRKGGDELSIKYNFRP